MPPVLTAAPAARPPSGTVRFQRAALPGDVTVPPEGAAMARALAIAPTTARPHLAAQVADGPGQRNGSGSAARRRPEVRGAGRETAR
ncbi:hypothetical protein [Kitasatospora sp. NPDC088783]|uniref:hypothetical protein n=1 Tax=Kitasatospora sp. NPDC088783 TaxID=3364077 RepID=UPI0037F63BB5